jgi:5'-nucleotidase
MAQPLILVTNDDGVEARGIKALAEALGGLGEVHVVAPDQERSASSHSLNVTEPLRAEEVEPNVHAVNGTPADCVHLAVVELLPRRPDIVVSGINQGPNLGDDIYRSGTVGGAREGALLGVPAVAISLAARGVDDFTHAAGFARRLAALVLERGLPERNFLNVNVPPGVPEGVRVSVQFQPAPAAVLLEGPGAETKDDWAQGDRERWESDAPSDRGVVGSGRISMTLLQADCSNHRLMGRLQEWARELDGGGRDEQPRVTRAEEG